MGDPLQVAAGLLGKWIAEFLIGFGLAVFYAGTWFGKKQLKELGGNQLTADNFITQKQLSSEIQSCRQSVVSELGSPIKSLVKSIDDMRGSINKLTLRVDTLYERLK